MNKSKIKVLDAATVEKIAAGEVIERPASVVKELVENAIDAQAQTITIELRGGGGELIRVIDDGIGMNERDAKLAVQRHATSKINSHDDLFRVRTMGFRGEALSSISAVSLFSLETAQKRGKAVSLRVENGEVQKMSYTARPRGTTVTAEELFYNTPARKKFLKSERSELNRIISIVEEIAMAHNQTKISVRHNQRFLLDLAATNEPSDRLAHVLGKDIVSQCSPLEVACNGLQLRGMLGHPQIARNNTSYQYLFVNHRPVTNRILYQGIKQAYGNLIPNGRFAVFVLFLDIDPDLIDVNVHPTKREVRFSKEDEIRRFVFSQASKVLAESGFSMADFAMSDVAAVAPPMSTRATDLGSESSSLSLFRDQQTLYEVPERSSGSPVPPISSAGQVLGVQEQTEEPLLETSVTYFQLHDLYILTQIKNGLLMIDQHAAHERILYEKALDDLDQDSGISQQLLFPVVMELKPAEYHLFEGSLDYFRKIGFDVKVFGNTSIAVQGIPPVASVGQVEQILRDMMAYLFGTQSTSRTIYDRMAASFACGAAIKAGTPLSQEAMASLVDTLFNTKNPYTCPHGRPTVVRLSLDDISKRFMR